MRLKASLLILIYLVLNPLSSQLLCPVGDADVFGGDGQNIISWNEPTNNSTFTVELTTDTYGSETSWDLVNSVLVL